jgi:phospholipid/cholesterol/gamma-HCH transport system substrate-binding protein
VAEVATGFAVLAVTAGFLAYALGHTGRSSAAGLTLRAQFDNVGALAAGADVRLSGVSVGHVIDTTIDPKTFQAVVHFTVQSNLKLPTDSSATISTGGLLGSPFLTLSPGGAEADLKDGGVVTITQSATNLEDLLGKFIFNVGSLADATQKSLKQQGAAASDPAKP